MMGVARSDGVDFGGNSAARVGTSVVEPLNDFVVSNILRELACISLTCACGNNRSIGVDGLGGSSAARRSQSVDGGSNPSGGSTSLLSNRPPSRIYRYYGNSTEYYVML